MADIVPFCKPPCGSAGYDKRSGVSVSVLLSYLCSDPVIMEYLETNYSDAASRQSRILQALILGAQKDKNLRALLIEQLEAEGIDPAKAEAYLVHNTLAPDAPVYKALRSFYKDFIHRRVEENHQLGASTGDIPKLSELMEEPPAQPDIVEEPEPETPAKPEHQPSEKVHHITNRDIMASLHNVSGIEPADLQGKSHQAKLVTARFAYYVLARFLFSYMTEKAGYPAKSIELTSLPYIGRTAGGRDHSTILYGINKVIQEILPDNTHKKHEDLIKYLQGTIDDLLKESKLEGINGKNFLAWLYENPEIECSAPAEPDNEPDHP